MRFWDKFRLRVRTLFRRGRMEAELDRVYQLNLVSYVLVVSALLGTTLLAAYIPARRASRLDPTVVLRQG